MFAKYFPFAYRQDVIYMTSCLNSELSVAFLCGANAVKKNSQNKYFGLAQLVWFNSSSRQFMDGHCIGQQNKLELR